MLDNSRFSYTNIKSVNEISIVYVLSFLFIILREMNMNTGKTIDIRIPDEMLPPRRSAAKPVRVGPAEHPTSPARARNANIAVPHEGRSFAAMLNVPGQNIPTEKPQSVQPARLNAGYGESDVAR